jgi:hypothetical protein
MDAAISADALGDESPHDIVSGSRVDSGLLVQTPEGVEEISFNINGVDVQMGSTVLFQADADAGMTVSTLEGAAFIAADDGVQLIPPGASSRIRLARTLLANGAPEIPTSYENKLKALRALPLRLLQRKETHPRPVVGSTLRFFPSKGMSRCRRFRD